MTAWKNKSAKPKICVSQVKKFCFVLFPPGLGRVNLGISFAMTLPTPTFIKHLIEKYMTSYCHQILTCEIALGHNLQKM